MSLADQIEREQKLAREARKEAFQANARVEQLVERARELREAIADKREHRKELDAEQDKTQRERIADKIEVLEEALDQVVARLERQHERHEKWADERRHHIARIERLRERGIRIREDREGQLTEHYHLEEFRCRDGTPVPGRSIPALRDWCQRIGEPIRSRFGAVAVHSGFRTAPYNASIGGASNSVHVYDAPYQHDPYAVAVDFSCAQGTPADWYAATAGLADGRGRYSTFHHADNRNRIGWPDATWSG